MGNHILRSKNVLGVSILTSVTIITGALLNSIKVDAVSTSAQATVNVEEACTMNSTITTPHTATIPNGTYQADIGTTTINVICNDSQGYAIYAVGYTGDEIGGENSTKLVNATGNANTIATGTATSGNTSNWAMKISTSGSNFVGTIDNSFSSYHAVPNEYTKVAHYNSATDAGNNATGSTYQTTYAAFVSSTQLAGNYAGKVKYTMAHPANEFVPHEVACQANRICYNPNTAIVEGQMGKQNVGNNASTVLYAPNFKRNGYGFAGWNDKYDYSGNYYGPNQTITAPADIQTNGLSLYAVWIKSAGTLQNWDGCDSLAQGATTALTDERDGNTYAVAKLADNECWMIENLRLDDTPELTSSNTHNPSLPLNNSWYYKNQQGTLTTSNHLSAPSDPTSTDSDTAWCQANYSSDCIEQSMLATNNTALFTNNTSTSYNTESNVYSYGNYYNWYSATAGHGDYSYTLGAVTPGDICPAGWHLPIGDKWGDFSTLDVRLGGKGEYQSGDAGLAQSAKWRSYPNNFLYSGGVSNSSLHSRSSSGIYWSSSGSNNNYAYFLNLANSTVHPTNYDSKYNGKIVRCVAGVLEN